MDSDLKQLGFLLLVSALVAMLTRRVQLPYTVGLVLAGMLAVRRLRVCGFRLRADRQAGFT
jgi:Kef-type K+ transport system membrane component KefB